MDLAGNADAGGDVGLPGIPHGLRPHVWQHFVNLVSFVSAGSSPAEAAWLSAPALGSRPPGKALLRQRVTGVRTNPEIESVPYLASWSRGKSMQIRQRVNIDEH